MRTFLANIKKTNSVTPNLSARSNKIPFVETYNGFRIVSNVLQLLYFHMNWFSSFVIIAEQIYERHSVLQNTSSWIDCHFATLDISKNFKYKSYESFTSFRFVCLVSKKCCHRRLIVFNITGLQLETVYAVLLIIEPNQDKTRKNLCVQFL